MFKGTEGWLQTFMLQHGLSLRRKTTTAEQNPHHLIDKLLSYILQVRGLPHRHRYQPSCIITMDEIPVWEDMVSNTTVDRMGASYINLKTTGHEKVMVAVYLSARADSTKLKPFIVFRAAKRETKKLNEDLKHKCVVTTSSNAWMNEDLTLNWFKSTWGAFFLTDAF